ncbi:MAG TPA: hypothetical protein IGS53_21590 [Leptolyngbyaceae cyanobacterium M33_DOE_097]|nr:hypothetical protein [Leptolyngbyaceae cyanobacterium M33_DOE_097]
MEFRRMVAVVESGQANCTTFPHLPKPRLVNPRSQPYAEILCGMSDRA